MSNILGPDPAKGGTLVRPVRSIIANDSDHWFNTCADPADPSATRLVADWFNSVTAALRKIVRSAGVTDLESSDDLIAEAIARYASLARYGTGGGTGNAQTVTKIGSVVVPQAYVDGMEVIWNPIAVNNGAATLAPFGLPPKSIVDVAGNPLTGGELQPPCVGRYNLAADKIVLMPWSGLQFAFSSLRARLAAGQTPTVNTFTTLTVAAPAPLPPWVTQASGVFTLQRAGTYQCVATLGHNNANPTGFRIIRERASVLQGLGAASHTPTTTNQALNCSGMLTDGQVGDKIYIQVFEGTTNPIVPVSISASGSDTYTELTIARIAN